MTRVQLASPTRYAQYECNMFAVQTTRTSTRQQLNASTAVRDPRRQNTILNRMPSRCSYRPKPGASTCIDGLTLLLLLLLLLRYAVRCTQTASREAKKQGAAAGCVPRRCCVFSGHHTQLAGLQAVLPLCSDSGSRRMAADAAARDIHGPSTHHLLLECPVSNYSSRSVTELQPGSIIVWESFRFQT